MGSDAKNVWTKTLDFAIELRDASRYFVTTVMREPTRRGHFTLKMFAVMTLAMVLFLAGVRFGDSLWSLVLFFFGGVCLGRTAAILKHAYDEDDEELKRAHAARLLAIEEKYAIGAEQYDKGMHVGASIVAEVAGLPKIPPPVEWGNRP